MLKNKKLTKKDLLWDEKSVSYFEIGRSIRSVRAKDPTVKIGFYAGDFDELTPADCVFLQLCRTRCDIFVLAMPTDYSMRLNKKIPTFPTLERIFRMGSMVYTNYIVPYDEQDCSLCLSSVDPDFVFWGRTQGDKEMYSMSLNKDKLTFIEYPWRNKRIPTKFFNI